MHEAPACGQGFLVSMMMVIGLSKVARCARRDFASLSVGMCASSAFRGSKRRVFPQWLLRSVKLFSRTAIASWCTQVRASARMHVPLCVRAGAGRSMDLPLRQRELCKMRFLAHEHAAFVEPCVMLASTLRRSFFVKRRGRLHVELPGKSSAFAFFRERSTRLNAAGRWEDRITYHLGKDKMNALEWADVLRAFQEMVALRSAERIPLPSIPRHGAHHPTAPLPGRERKLFNFTSALQNNPNAW